MRQELLVLALGFAFLVVVTGLGTFNTNDMPTMNTPQVQMEQIGPSIVTLHVYPNPPSTGQPATFSMQIRQSASPRLVNGAHVVVNGTIEDMEMDTASIEAKAQEAGMYVARLPFNTDGSWQRQISFALPGWPQYSR